MRRTTRSYACADVDVSSCDCDVSYPSYPSSSWCASVSCRACGVRWT
jgi:hypothetical protein